MGCCPSGGGCGKEGLLSEARVWKQRRLACLGMDNLAGRVMRGEVLGSCSE